MEISVAGVINWLRSSRARHSGDLEVPCLGGEILCPGEIPLLLLFPKNTPGHPFHGILGQIWLCRILRLESVLSPNILGFFLPLFLIPGSRREEPLPGMLSHRNSRLLRAGMNNQPQEGPGVHGESRKLGISPPTLGHFQSQVLHVNSELFKFSS